MQGLSSKVPPLVTAIITTRNRLEYLKVAVISMLNQTYSNMEYIVVDDDSDAATCEYLDNLQRTISNFTHVHIESSESCGGNYARNRGIQAARGDFIAFLDDDDEWLPEKTTKQVELFRGGVGLVYCGRILEHIDGVHKPWREIDTPVDAEFTGDLSKKCFTQIFCTTSAMMVSRQVLNQIGGFDESICFWQETEFCIRACQVCAVDAVDEPLMVLRLNEADSNRLSNKYEGWLEAVDQINEKHKSLIEALPSEYRIRREIMTLRDSLVRQRSAGVTDLRPTLYKIWRLSGSPKDFVKFILNRSRLRPQWLMTSGETEWETGVVESCVSKEF